MARSFVRLGEHDASAFKLFGSHEDIDVVKIDAHPDSNKSIATYDIAILTLKRDVKFTGKESILRCFLKWLNSLQIACIWHNLPHLFLRPICLPLNEPLKYQNYTGMNPFVAGHTREWISSCDFAAKFFLF